MIETKHKRRAIQFNPGWDTLIAGITAALMIGVYYFNARYGYEAPAVFFVGFIGIGHLLLNTAIPAFVVFVLCKESWSGLGIKRENALKSLMISAGLAALFFGGLMQALEGFDGDPLPHIIFNGIALWEPLFVYGWLQIRFEKAFGFLPSPFLAGAAFAAYHLGSVPLDMVFTLFAFGVFYGVIFGLVRNLLALIPLTWAVGSSIGTINAGFSFDWFTVALYACVLVVQALMLLGLYGYASKRAGRSRSNRHPPS